MERQHAEMMAAMIKYDKGDARRIQHLVKVHDLAATIGTLEGLDADTMFVLETAAILHDIGIHISEEKYGSCNGKQQEKEGPSEADSLMRQVGGYTEEQMDRVKFLIGHHHTYKDMVGQDYQILVEADFLVNLFEEGSSEKTIRSTCRNIFRTKAGIALLQDMFLAEE